MISLTDFLLLLILAIFTTYTFMPWSSIDKGSKRKIGLQFIFWVILFGLVAYVLSIINFLI